MKQILKLSTSSKTILGIILMSIVVLYYVRWNGNSGQNWNTIISSDGYGYYQYYKAFLFDKNLENQTENQVFLLETGGEVVNKYYIGLPVLWSPFIMTTYFFDSQKTDPFAIQYQIAISIAALFFLFLGLLAARKFLLNLGFSQKTTSISLLVFFFGTNLSYYSIIGCSMSHVYSFALITIFIYYLHSFYIKNKAIDLYISSILFGLIILIRPTNGIAILLIFLFLKSFDELKYFVFQIIKSKKKLFISIFLFLLLLSIQIFFWYLQTGKYFIWSYNNEGFYFSNPKFFDFLFSFRKGLFVYTPLCLITLGGLYLIKKRSSFQFYSITLSLLLIIYLLSSWWNWYYGDSFGMRSIIDFYIIFIFLFALLLQKVFDYKWKRWTLLTGSVIFVLLNLFQSYQYYSNIMSHFDMNFNKYSYIFGKYSNDYQYCLGGNSDCEPYHKKPMVKIDEHKTITFQLNYLSENDSCLIIDKNEYQPLVEFQIADLKLENNLCFAKINFQNYNLTYGSCQNVFFVLDIRNSKDEVISSYRFKINDIPSPQLSEWIDNKHELTFIIPKMLSNKLVFYLHNPELNSFLIKDFTLDIFHVK